MNRPQIVVVAIGLAVFLLMGMFPPWKVMLNGGQTTSEYRFLLEPPKVGATFGPAVGRFDQRTITSTDLHYSRLIIQWVIVILPCGCIALLLSNRVLAMFIDEKSVEQLSRPAVSPPARTNQSTGSSDLTVLVSAPATSE
jgi:hypothetical protein